MRMPQRRTVALALPAALSLGLLAGCGGDTARTLGFTRDAPDEFQVVTRAPLSLPPDMNNLPVPRPGAVRPQELSAREQGESALVPGAVLESTQASRQSSGESALVARAGGTVDPAIRRRVDEESLRLRENFALGRPPGDGETPIIQRKERGIFDGLF